MYAHGDCREDGRTEAHMQDMPLRVWAVNYLTITAPSLARGHARGQSSMWCVTQRMHLHRALAMDIAVHDGDEICRGDTRKDKGWSPGRGTLAHRGRSE